MNKFRWLNPMLEAEGEIGAESEESLSVEGSEIAAEQTHETETVETPIEDISKSASFAKRLSEEKVKWEKETIEKYKDYELHKDLSTYLSELNGGEDLLSLKERAELERLEARAEKENVPPEVLKRIDELEARAKEGEKIKQEQQETQRVTTYFSTMEKFLEGKGAKSEELNQFMVDNKLSYDPDNMEKSFDIAYKAMKADEFEKRANEKEAETIKRYIASKNAPKVEGSAGSAATQSVDTSKMSWKDVDKAALARLEASKQPQ